MGVRINGVCTFFDFEGNVIFNSGESLKDLNGCNGAGLALNKDKNLFAVANGNANVNIYEFEFVDGVPTFSGDGKPIDRTTWSGAMENVVGNANWKYTSFFEDERFAEKWGWFLGFWNEQITTTPKADGSAYTYTIDNKYAWRQALQAYLPRSR